MFTMRAAGMFDLREFFKRIRRFFDGNYSYRKILLLIIIFGGFFVYLSPSIAQWLFSSHRKQIEAYEEHCMDERLAGFYFDSIEYNANILHKPPKEKEHQYLPYLGNGVFGIGLDSESSLYIRNGRSLSLRIPWKPLIYHKVPEDTVHREATITHYTSGIVYKYDCLREGYYIGYQYYAHRELDGILVQNIKVSNFDGLSPELYFEAQEPLQWTNSHFEQLTTQVDRMTYHLNSISGYVMYPNSNKIVCISIIYQSPPKTARGATQMEYLTSIKYSEPVTLERYHQEKEILTKQAIENMRIALLKQQKGLKDIHVSIWQKYWKRGFAISDSKAKDSLNGHKINSTIYYVLSQVSKGLPDIEKSLTNNEGCYRGHHTLDATRLWQDTSTIESIIEVARAWSITLDKQGCHRLLVGGPSAILQAMVLSFGSLRFSNQDLQFYIDPQHLHRDFLFRRISYGNLTHLNITVTVNEDNRAVLGVAVDHSDSAFYGCDAGCLHEPIRLSHTYTNFPVKLTKPFTPILYITSDHQHMLDLKNALHVESIDEAPAHDHQVMALHKHGHQLGGLPTFFWISIFFLIIVFHLFLFKLIITEYWAPTDRQKVRYNKP